MTSKVNRRRFVASTAAGIGAMASVPAVVRAASLRQELHVACVGVNGMGWSDLSNIGSHPSVQLVGFCDVDLDRFDRADAAFPNLPHFADFRAMFEKLADRFDAVSVSTPDHMHAPITLAALALGKHVFCQKPLTHTVWEARQVRLAAQRAGVVTQMGNQIHSQVEYRLATRLVQDGAIGKISEVHSWVAVQGRQYCQRTDRPAPADVPPNLSWDLWLGVAPVRPYAESVYHPFNWRDWQDFGSGALGDFGCHILDPVFTALELTAPITIRAEHDGTNDEVWPGPQTVAFTFPGTSYTVDDRLSLTWRDGGLRPPLELAGLPQGTELPASGSLFVGEGGTMVLPHVGMPQLYPEAKFKNYTWPDVEGYNHWHVWVDAVLAGRQTSDGFQYAGPLTETVQLGNVASRLRGRELAWDAEALRVPDDSQATTLLSKTYRTGWEIAQAGRA